MHEIILCKLGEVVLKGLNRRSFEMKLMSNIRRRTQPFGKFKIYSRQSTIYVEPVEDACDIAGAYAACKQVFGIIAITRALPCEKSREAILDTAKTYLAGALTAARSFKVESKRADKTFPMGSIQLSQWVGGALHDAFPHLTVDVHHPELTVYVEVREDAAYVHGPAEAAAGGLPLGMGGHAVSLLSGGIDSPVSSYMIAKRGVQLEMIHFASPPYTSELAREKVLKLAQELTPWCGRLAVFIIPFTEIQEEIRRKCPEDHFTLIMRRFMMRLADQLAHELRCRALVTGENLGQVASQTMQALAVSEDVTTMLLHRVHPPPPQDKAQRGGDAGVRGRAGRGGPVPAGHGQPGDDPRQAPVLRRRIPCPVLRRSSPWAASCCPAASPIPMPGSCRSC